MPKAILIRGPTAVGKSTIAKELVDNLGENWLHFECENFIQPYFKRKVPNMLKLTFDNACYCMNNFFKYGYNLVIEGRFLLEQDYLKKVLSVVKKHTSEYVVFELNAPKKTLIARNKQKMPPHRKNKKKFEMFLDIYKKSDDKSIIKINNKSKQETVEYILKKSRMQ